MMGGMIASFLGALFFAAAGYLGALLGSTFAERITPFADGPPQENAPVLILIIACGALGAIITPHAAAQSQLLLIALVCVALVAIWVTDARRGIVPDAFTLGPLAIMLTVALWQHQWWLFVSAVVPFVPFAIAALLSRGRGMGWGDVKLVALGGAILGAQLSVLAFALACLAAVGINYARGRKHGAIAFAPYLASAIGIAIPLGMWR
jgi:prepilin signal peptidase PulO-like enzyme (type II secretory pathway)